MKQAFEAVQQEFMRLGTLLGRIDFDSPLTDKALIAQINDSLTDTYVLLNQGFCESATMCKKCIDNRNSLRELIELIDLCEEEGVASETACLALDNFSRNIPEILTKMESVYLQSLQDVQA